MSNERLERIKERVNYHGHLDDDIEWLIKQAEKVEYWRKQHRKRCNELEDAHFKIQLIENQLHQAQAKAERYKQALEFYANEKNYERAYDDEVLFDYLPSEIDFDNGEKARKELGKEA